MTHLILDPKISIKDIHRIPQEEENKYKDDINQVVFIKKNHINTCPICNGHELRYLNVIITGGIERRAMT